MKRYTLWPALAGLAFAAVACGGGGGGETAQPSNAEPAAAAPEAAAPAGSQTPDAGGRIDSVDMYTDAAGNYFKPRDLTVHQGDVIRFMLGSGVHNASFPADSNPGARGLPAEGDYLQLPGQTYDVKVAFKPGTYYYQCDAHAALGMTGHVTVQPR